MTPATRKQCRPLRLGMTGVKIPRHVGTWAVERAMPAITPKGDVTALFVLCHEWFSNAGRMIATNTGEIIYAKIPIDWQDQMEKKGWRF